MERVLARESSHFFQTSETPPRLCEVLVTQVIKVFRTLWRRVLAEGPNVDCFRVCGRSLAVAIAMRKRIYHVFPVNPYGGKPDHGSQLEGRVRNIGGLVS